MRVTVAGAGLAGLTCAWLLARRGHRVRLSAPTGGGPSRPLILNRETVDLLRSLWVDRDLLTDAPGLTHRVVRWGVHARPRRVPAPGVLVDGAALAGALRARLVREHPELTRPPHDPRWTLTSTPGPHLVAAGRRHLVSGTTPHIGDPGTTILTCTDTAWIHLTPLQGESLVQVVVPGPVDDPAATAAREIAAAEDLPDLPVTGATVIPAAPGLHPTPVGPDTMMIGTGALRCDPLSGTGTAQALRTAVLAAAVIHDDRPAAREHYARRIRRAFRDHLATCAALYPEAFPHPSWRAEHDLARVLASPPARRPAE